MQVQGNYTEKEYSRSKAEFKNSSERFILETRDFKMQYASLYRARYEKCLPLLKKRVDELWGKDDCPMEEICNLQCDKRSVVIGIIFKSMPKQPSILREISEDIPEDAPAAVLNNDFTSDEDSLIIEDLRQRIAIRSSDLLNPQEIVTGVPIALMGSVDEEDAHFVVEKVAYIGIQSLLPRPTISDSVSVVFIGGLNLCEMNDLTPMQLFVDYLTGMIGSDIDLEQTAKACRLVVCGNSVAPRSNSSNDTATFSLRKEVPDNAAYMSILDAYMNALTQSIPVDVMPGSIDPTNSQLPQQPLNQVLFPRSAVNTNLNAVTNPYEFTVSGIRFLGTSGQNVNDIMRYSRISSPIEVLKCIVKWGHLVPTAPDTTPAYPQQKSDPFLIEETPHVLFAGDQEEFACEKYTDPSGHTVILLCIPAFHKKQSCVWFNLKSFEAKKMDFIVDEDYN